MRSKCRLANWPASAGSPGRTFLTEIPAIVVSHAADVLGETNQGLSGGEIVKVTAAYALDWDVQIPHPVYPLVQVSATSARPSIRI